MKSNQSEINALKAQAELLEAEFVATSAQYEKVAKQRDSLVKGLAVVDPEYLKTKDLRAAIAQKDFLTKVMQASSSFKHRNPSEPHVPGQDEGERSDKKKDPSSPAPEPTPREEKREDDTPQVNPSKRRGR